MAQSRRTRLLRVPEVRFNFSPKDVRKARRDDDDDVTTETAADDSAAASNASESSSEHDDVAAATGKPSNEATPSESRRMRRLHSSAVYDALRPTHPRLASYWMALRPWSFSASLAPVALGTALAYKSGGGDAAAFHAGALIATLFTVLSVHGAGNLVNSFFDYHRGIDSARADDRTLVDAILTTEEVINFGALLYFLGCVGFVAIDWLSPARMEHLALIYFGGLSSSFLYTGGFGLKYIALGDVVIVVTFGPVCVLFAFIAQAGRLSLLPLAYAIPLALNTEAILHANNARDAATDARAGIVTLPILLGATAAYALFVLLLFAPYMMLTVAALHCGAAWLLLPLLTLPVAFRMERQYRGRDLRRLPTRLAKMNLAFGMLYSVGCLMTPTNQLPGFA
ncbi:PREDICTED: ubiA prenyltransferase domain-containing protein 1-like [Priapulus caudatus]|uniref:UbiA prenyltransferase domain-containing protein 1-like n=1 Tax=Priapulus caudatus TaxID=37621 RepID=A0ABM1E9J0_PRICU|nr:PREDICTED: ubiA prenyltransferase domain-containing protein 1-like [Priapulus caudatus]